MGLHGAGPIMVEAGARSAADRFVILIGAVTEGEIVHRALARCQSAGRCEERVGHDLACLDIACHHGSPRARIEHRSFRHNQFDRTQAAIVHGNGIVDQRAHDIKCRCACYGFGRVEIIGQLSAGAGEIEDGRSLIPVDPDGYLHHRTVVHRIGECAVVQPVEQPPDAFLRIGENVVHIGGHHVRSLIARG